jgi:hypothetical protein
MRHLESKLQASCVLWFGYQYHKYSKLLIAVPNGGYRNAVEAKIMKGEGVTPGVSDLLLLIPMKGFGCLGIEMKSDKGKQTVNQFEWQKEFEKNGNKYAVCKSLDEFIIIINDYLK